MNIPIHDCSSTLAALTWLVPGDLAIKSAFILVAAWAMVLVMRRASAATRHLVWVLAVCATLTMPLLSGLAPKWCVLPPWTGLETSPATSVAATGTMSTPPATAPPDMIDGRSVHSQTMPPAASTIGETVGVDGIPSRSIAPPPQAIPSAVTETLSVARHSQTNLARWQTGIEITWILGAALLAIPILISSLSLWQLGRRLPRIEDPSWTTLCRDLAANLQLGRPVVLLRGRPRAMPMTWGFFHPKLVLPPEADGWSPQRRRVVLMHELAHVKRGDFAIQFIVHLARAVYWFNPLMWVASRQIAIESEGACDDLVLRNEARPSDYAEHLLAIATGLRERFLLHTAAVAMARSSRLQARLVDILDGRRNRARLTAARVAVLGLLLAALIIPVAALRAGNANAWAQQHRWTAQDVQATTLTSQLGGWRNLPFSLSKEEEADARACVKLAQKSRQIINGQSQFNRPETRRELEELLGRRRSYFYAEFLLGLWHRDNGDRNKADTLMESAYKDAPVVVVQRFASADLTPIANVVVQSFALECNRVENGSLDPSLKLYYPNLRMDSNGCIYLPVYNTVYRTDSMASPEGYDVAWPKLGWFETSAKVALLPTATVTRQGTPPATQPGLASKPVIIDGVTVEIATVKVADAIPQAPQINADDVHVAPGQLTGIVTDETGNPIAGALVDVWTWCPGDETHTDAQGRYILKKLGTEPVEIRVSKENYGAWHSPEQPTGVQLNVKLSNKTFFVGDVKGPDGKPVKNALVRADSGPKHNPSVEITNLWTETRTDENGHYRMYVMPDKYIFQARVPEIGTARLPATEIVAGEVKTLNINLTPGLAFRAIVVDGQTGAPVPNIRLSNWQHKGIEGTSDKDGNVTIDGMPDGRFVFNIQAKGYARWWSQQAAQDHQKKETREGFHRNFDDLDFDITRDMKPVRIELERAVRVTGVVQDPDGNLVAGATAAPAHTGTGNSLAGDTRFSVVTKNDGTFDMSLPASGGAKYNLEAHDGQYEQWRKWANGVLPPIQTMPGDELKNVVIRLTRPATVSGHMKDETGKPLADRDVRASAADKMENRYYDPTTRTDKNGNFVLRFIRPGDQFIQAAPFFWTNVPEGGMTLKLKEGETNSLQVTLKEGENKTGVELTAPASAAFPSFEEQLHQAIEKSERSKLHPKAMEGVPIPATQASLAKWLEDKEVVEVTFVGAKMDLQDLRRSLKSADSLPDDFRLTPGEGGGTGGSFLTAQMKVTPETTKLLLAMQEELAPRGYVLDSRWSIVWSYKADEKLREQARKLVPEMASAVEKAIKLKYPKAEVVYEQNARNAGNLVGLTYKVPDTNASGLFRISETTTVDQSWLISISPDQRLHLPHLGLIVQTYYRNGQSEDSSPEHIAIRNAIEESLAPLMKLEPDAAIQQQTAPSGAKTAAPAPQAGLTYGPVVDGLQLALELQVTDGVVPMGKPIKVKLHFRNAGQFAIKLKNPTLWQPSSDEFVVTDADGKSVQTCSAWFSFWDVGRVDELQPGQSVGIDSHVIAFFPGSFDHSNVPYPVGNYAFVKPGKYALQYKLRCPTFANEPSGCVVWHDQLATPPLPIKVAMNDIPPAKQADPMPQYIDFSGVVVDDATGKPVSNFSVQGGRVDEKDLTKMTWGYTLQTTTNPNPTGRFSSRVDWSGGWRSRIVADGYVGEPIMLKLPDGNAKEFKGLVIRLKRGRRVSGHVLDHTGKPVSDAGVFVVGNPSVNLTGGNAMELAGGLHEDKKAVRFITDVSGAFIVTGIAEDRHHIAVTCPGLDLWVVEVPKEGGNIDDLTIRLPEPGKLVVHYDIPGAPEKAEIFLQYKTWELFQDSHVENHWYAPIRKQKETVLANLAPGPYVIDRTKNPGNAYEPARAMLDRREITIESGKTTTLDFVRPNGAPITGQVIGLDQGEVAKAQPHRVEIRVVPMNEDQWSSVAFDDITMEKGGKSIQSDFITEQLSPGQYKVRVLVFVPETPEQMSSTGIVPPAFTGETVVTVPGIGKPDLVKVELKPWKYPAPWH
jgi:beta-lactamase regulating signal transducer with metallopeptidase domain/protocatechuate 3,4-dioxygenase beta subunit